MNQESLRSVMAEYKKSITPEKAKSLKDWFHLHSLLQEQINQLSQNITYQILDSETPQGSAYDTVHQFIQDIQ